MNDYFIYQADRYVLARRIGGHVLNLVSDTQRQPLENLLAKARDGLPEQKLFLLIYHQYSGRALLRALPGKGTNQ